MTVQEYEELHQLDQNRAELLSSSVRKAASTRDRLDAEIVAMFQEVEPAEQGLKTVPAPHCSHCSHRL